MREEGGKKKKNQYAMINLLQENLSLSRMQQPGREREQKLGICEAGRGDPSREEKD